MIHSISHINTASIMSEACEYFIFTARHRILDDNELKRQFFLSISILFYCSHSLSIYLSSHTACKTYE